MILRTIIVPASLVNHARELGSSLSAAGAGMYTTALSSTGADPATHYVSSGLIDEQFAALLYDPVMLYGAAQQNAAAQGLTLNVTQTQVNNLVSQSLVGDENVDPLAFIADNGLMLINEPL